MLSKRVITVRLWIYTCMWFHVIILKLMMWAQQQKWQRFFEVPASRNQSEEKRKEVCSCYCNIKMLLRSYQSSKNLFYNGSSLLISSIPLDLIYIQFFQDLWNPGTKKNINCRCISPITICPICDSNNSYINLQQTRILTCSSYSITGDWLCHSRLLTYVGATL